MPGPKVTADNLTPLIKVITWLMLAFTCLSVGARMLVKLHIIRKVSSDDWLLLAGWLFSIGQSVTITLAAIAGLGQHQSSLSASQLADIQKNLYASQLLYLPAICLAKASVVKYLHAISPISWHHIMTWTTLVLVVLWGISAEFVSAFRCSIPNTWQFISGNKCINLAAFSRYSIAMNLITEILLVLLPILVIVPLQMSAQKKLTSVSIFLVRIGTVAAAACQLAFSHLLNDSNDFVFSVWPYVIITQITQAAVLIATCSLYTRSLLGALESGMIRVDDVQRRGEDPATYNASYGSKASYTKMSSLPASGAGTRNAASHEDMFAANAAARDIT